MSLLEVVGLLGMRARAHGLPFQASHAHAGIVRDLQGHRGPVGRAVQTQLLHNRNTQTLRLQPVAGRTRRVRPCRLDDKRHGNHRDPDRDRTHSGAKHDRPPALTNALARVSSRRQKQSRGLRQQSFGGAVAHKIVGAETYRVTRRRLRRRMSSITSKLGARRYQFLARLVVHSTDRKGRTSATFVR